MTVYINPLRQLVIWESNLYDGYVDCDKLNKDLTYNRNIFSCNGSLPGALKYGVENGFIPDKGWIKLDVETVESWESLWPVAMEQLRNKTLENV